MRKGSLIGWLSRVTGGAAAMPLLAMAAQAQILPPEDSVRFSRNVAVRDRQQAGYETAGMAVGSFTLSPRLDVNTNYTDNIFALEQGSPTEAFVRFAPSADLQSNWTNRSLTLSASGSFDRYFSRSTENVDDLAGSIYGTVELGGELRVRAIARFRSTRESRESQNAFALTRRPVLYRDGTGAVGVSKRFSNLLVSGEAGIDRTDYDNARLQNGDVLEQNYRDGTIRQFRLRADLLHSPSVATFVQVLQARSIYAQRTPLGVRRGAETLEALGGVRFELPILAQGEIGIGYIESTYRDGRFRRFAGLAVNSRVTFFPTQLTNVSLSAVRSVNDAGTPDSSTYVALVGGVRVDHELLRALILTAGANVEQDRFNGVDRQDVRFAVDVGAEYRLNRYVAVRFNADRLQLSSTGVARYKSFTRNRVLVGVGLKV